MPKTKISEYSTTNSDNTDIENINIAEGCAPSGINNAIRELMVHLKEFQTGASGDAFTFAGGTLMSGTNTISGAAIISGNINSSGTNTFSGSNVMSFSGGSSASPSIYFASDTNTGIFSPAADTIAFAEGGAESMRIDSSGNVGIGTSSPSYKVNAVVTSGADAFFADANAQSFSGYRIRAGASGQQWAFRGGNTTMSLTDVTAGADRLVIDSSGNLLIGQTTSATSGRGVTVNGSQQSFIVRNGISEYNEIGIWSGTSNDVKGQFQANANSSTVLIGARTNHAVAFSTNDTERARITSGGELLVGKTSDTFSTAGATIRPGGSAAFTVTSNEILDLNRLSTDGQLQRFYQDSTQEGNISVSGTTVSYNGGHLSRWAQMPGTKDDTIVKGTVMSNLDEMNVYIAPTTYWTEEDELPEGVNVGDVKVETHTVDNEQLNKVKVSDVEGDVNVAGVFVNWEQDDAHQVDEINMAMTGDMIIRIAQGVVVQKGDLLMSAGDGTAKPQGDDIVRSKTVAKVTSNHVTCTYADGSYCVPCVLMAC